MATNYYDRKNRRAEDNPCRGVEPEKYVWEFTVHSDAHLDEWLKDYFGDINLTHQKDGTSVLQGALTDMAAVYGLIMKLRDSGICFISLQAERKIATERR